MALNSGDAAMAIEALRPAIPDELGVPNSAVHALFGALYPVYERGEAYLSAGQSQLAIVEFRKILDHPGIVVVDPIGALARLQLGRAYAMQGDTIEAKAQYHDFLTLWKGADPNVPILKQAQTESSKL